MIHYLRTKENNTIVDIETTNDDLQCDIDIRFYTFFLLALEESKRLEFMTDIDRIDDLRAEWFDVKPDFPSISAFVKFVFQIIAKKWSLFYVEK